MILLQVSLHLHMAKQGATDTIKQFNEIKSNISKGIFSPFYLLHGEEPYYVDLLTQHIIDNAIQPHERDFNQTIIYGSDTTPEDIISICSRFPMMAEKQLVVVKEGQMLKKIETMSIYLEHIVDTTILVLCFVGKSADKRTSFYKNASKHGVVFESNRIKEEAMPIWIEKYISSLGKKITPDAALLLSEYSGNELRKIALESDKLIKAIAPETQTIGTEEIERNIGISREFNATELANALATKDGEKAYKIGYYMGESPNKYPLQLTLGYLFYFFSKVEKIHAIRLNSNLSPFEAATQAGIYSRYATPFLEAVKHFPLKKNMRIISYLKECDMKSKGFLGGEASQKDLLTELISKIISI
jgi:DNA polymerase III subunit delta